MFGFGGFATDGFATVESGISYFLVVNTGSFSVVMGNVTFLIARGIAVSPGHFVLHLGTVEPYLFTRPFNSPPSNTSIPRSIQVLI